MTEPKHARLGCSNNRWPECAGSVREEERYPDIAGEAAIDGTGSHLLLEMCLQNNVSAAQYDQQIIGANHPDNPNGWMVDPARIKRVQMCLDYVKRRVNELKQQFHGCAVLVEAEGKADPGGAFGRDDWWGTVDITITARHPMSGDVYFIEVVDYKDGRGYVSEKNNTQLISYLFGKMRSFIASGPDKCRPFKPNAVPHCRMTIVQPKTNPVVRYQCSTRSEDNVSTATVVEAAEQLSVAARATDDPDAPLTPGNHCQWCKANPKRGGHCSAKSNQSFKTVESMSEIAIEADNSNLSEYIGKILADPKSLTEAQLSELADSEEGVQAIFDKVKTEIKDRIDQGITVPGYAMVPGKGSNVWNEDDETIAKKLKSRRLKNADIYPPKLISPAQVMKSDLLTDDQKARIQKELITFKGGKLALKKVAHDHVSEKVVAQSSTEGVESTEAELMFGNIVNNEAEAAPVEAPAEEVSFF